MYEMTPEYLLPIVTQIEDILSIIRAKTVTFFFYSFKDKWTYNNIEAQMLVSHLIIAKQRFSFSVKLDD